MENKKITSSYILFTVLSVMITWLLHEFSHWVTGSALGNQMIMTLNTSYPASGSYQESWHAILIALAGPLITIFQAVVIFIILKKKTTSINIFPFLLTCLYMRGLAGFMNVINLNDEGRVSQSLGLGTFTLPVLVILFLFYLVFRMVRYRSISSRRIFVTMAVIIVISSVLILTDQMSRIIILQG